MRRYLSTAVVLLLIAGPSLAIDYWGGPPVTWWSRGDPGATWQRWDYETADTMFDPAPDAYANDYGLPGYAYSGACSWDDDWVCPTTLAPDGDLGGFGALNNVGGSLQITLHIPNAVNLTGMKHIYVQITCTAPPTQVRAGGHGPDGDPVDSEWDTGRPPVVWEGPAPHGGDFAWRTYSFGLTLEPSTAGEDIIATFGPGTVVDQIVVDTLCTGIVADEASTWSGIKAMFD